MARSKSDVRSAHAWALAGKQHGIVTRRDLLDLGFSREAIDHRLTTGRLHLVTRGVYAVGWPGLTRERRWMAAVLACGKHAALSHHSAAALWGIGKEHRGQIDVSVRRRCELRRAGIRARGRPSLPRRDIVMRNGIPLTHPVRTLLDLATELRAKALERAVNEADKHDLIDPEALRTELDRYTGEPGVRLLRSLLDKHTFCLSDSELEILFRPIAISVGLPQPLTKAWVNGFEVDFYWPELGLVVETDGLRYHRTASTQTRDRVRDQTHVAVGLTPLRFTHWQVKYQPAHVRSVLRQTTARLR
ncbi:MAG: type IV toxin-antitoxin system AbiEi family antitoxin domain-containing protein [Solirubrobacterales bacterium]